MIMKIIVCLSAMVLVSGQFQPQSPCPDIFRYNGSDGLVKYEPPGQMKYVFMKITFSVIAQIQNRTGHIDIVGTKESALLRMLRGQPLLYRVTFPVAAPLPRLLSVVVNGQSICSGHSDPPSEAYSVEHLLFDKGDELNPLTIMAAAGGQHHSTTQSPLPLSVAVEGGGGEVRCGEVAGGNEQVELVYHGSVVEPGDWPWLVAVFVRKETKIVYTCAGSLVSREHIVTAAHCLNRKGIVRPLTDFVIKIGAHDLDDLLDPLVAVRGVRAAGMHDQYNSHTLANDLLILTLDSPVQFSKTIRPICLWTANSNLDLIVNRHGSVAGWGGNELRESGHGAPRVAFIPVVATDKCKSSRVEFHKLTATGKTICAGDRNGTGPCNGDSGSGLYLYSRGRWRLRGVVSVSLRPVTGEARCNLDEYVVFTDVAKYMPWVQWQLTGSPTVPLLDSSPSEPDCGVVSGGNDQVPLLYYGSDVAPGDWPWLVGVFRSTGDSVHKRELQFQCGGTILSETLVVTSGHCSGQRNSSDVVPELLVKAGINDITAIVDSKLQLRKLKAIHEHPHYDRNTYENNIALYELDSPLVYSAYVRPACLPTAHSDFNDIVGKLGTIVGWGYNEKETTGNTATMATIPIVSHETCLRSNKFFFDFLKRGTFCAGYRNGTSACQGDSGGGMYLFSEGRWHIRGVISLALASTEGVHRCKRDEFTVFVDVGEYADWIRKYL